MIEEHLQVNISQKALIVIEGKLFLVREDEGWELPGGRVNAGETDLTDALKREIKEELSAEINPKNIYKASLFKKKTGEDILVLVYECDLITPLVEIKIQEEEVLEWKLFSKDELKDLKEIYPNSTETVKTYLES